LIFFSFPYLGATMRRRKFIAGSIATIAHTFSAQAGGLNAWRIGQIFGGSSRVSNHNASALAQRLSELGYVDGKDIRVQTRFAAPTLKDMQSAILSMLPEIDLLVAWGTIGGAAAKAASPSIPVVFISVGAPVDIGLVESLAHPGGNMTGITFEAASETYGKRLQLLKVILPALTRVAVIGANNDPNVPFAMQSVRRAAASLSVSVTAIEISSVADLTGAFDRIKKEHLEAVLVVAGVLTYESGSLIAELAVTNGLPSCHAFKETVAAGGLISFGPDLFALGLQGANLVDKIIKGSRPGDLPVEQPTRYVTSINLKTAKALGLIMPPEILGSADEVLE
jgi:putative tryptophan/tyrosine transport system substrate-binding protein